MTPCIVARADSRRRADGARGRMRRRRAERRGRRETRTDDDGVDGASGFRAVDYCFCYTTSTV